MPTPTIDPDHRDPAEVAPTDSYHPADPVWVFRGGGGAVIGRHRGHHRFTVGQRRGIGLAVAGAALRARDRRRANRVVVGPRGGARRPAGCGSATRSCTGPARRVGSVRLRYRSRPLACRVDGGEPARTGRARARSSSSSRPGAEPPRPGQTAVLCDGDLVVGHGTIA